MEKFKRISLYCAVGETQATVNVRGGELLDMAKGGVESACPGCNHWTDEEVQRVDAKLEKEYGPGAVRRDRDYLLEQTLVDKKRFGKSETSEIVVGRCTPVGVR
jgi:hypothetical protein